MRKAVTLLASIILSASSIFSNADVFIGLSSKSKPGGKIKVSVKEFAPYRKNKSGDKKTADTLQDVVRADLMYSRYFEVSEYDAEKIDFSVLKKQGADYLIDAKAAVIKDKWIFSADIFNPYSEKKIVTKYYKGKENSLRRGGHVFSDYLVWKLTGKQGIARTRIAFSNNSSGYKELYIADYDGENLTKLTTDKSIILLPKWSPDGSKLYYTSYKNDNADLFEINLLTKTIKPFSEKQGINLPGAISPDGKTMVLTLSDGRDPNIYLMDMTTKKLKRMTDLYSVESSASYSPDGRFITFISDRSGNPQVHIMELETGSIRRLTRLNWCDSPKWSPSGEWIVFSGRINPKDNMDIFLADITGFRLRRLTKDAGSNEDPTWSPDGRFIAFTSTRNKSRQIYVMDSDGSAPHLISNIKGNSYTPNWSP